MIDHMKPSGSQYLLVRLFTEFGHKASRGIEVKTPRGRIRVGWFLVPNPTLIYLAAPERAYMTWGCPSGSWQMRVGRLAVAYQPNSEVSDASRTNTEEQP